MNHSELGDTYLTLLEAVEQTALSEAEVVLHSEEVWMYCPKVSKKEQLIKDTHSYSLLNFRDANVGAQSRGRSWQVNLSIHR